MRKFGILAAVLACASLGVLAAARPPAAQDDKAPRTESKRKTIVVERHGDDDGPNGDVLIRGFGEEGPRIGVSIANLDEEQARTRTGVVVTEVQENGPGAKAGLEEKDVITAFDGEKVRSARQLRRLVAETPAGRTVTLAAERDGTRVELKVTPEAQEMTWLGDLTPGMDPFTPDRMPRLHPGMPLMPEHGRQFRFEIPEGDRKFRFHTPGEGGDDTFDIFVAPGRGRLGVGIQDLSDQLAEFFGTKEGVLVSSVTTDSPAAKAGLRAGDVITSIDDSPVTSGKQLIEAVQRAGERATLKVGYVRDKKAATATATLEPKEREPRKVPAKPI